MELGTIRQVNIDSEMQASYLDYAMSVIVSRALPDVRDGLKPVHRRILYAMHDLGLTYDKPYKKSARIVGEVLGKYHPHGDAAVYEAMVRMAQDFSLRYPLVDGQGNFGSIDGDNAAAMRYTEARLARIVGDMLADIDKDTVDWTDNFDGTLKEPSVLPAALPNLLVNGSSGIAVGMATNIPPHNLGEVCDALNYLIDHYDHPDLVTVEELMQFIPGPDFPTGGVVYRYANEGSGDAAEQVDVIAHAYASGKGGIVMQAKAHIEEMSRSKNRIVITELPYQANKTNLLERIAELVRDGRLDGITDLRDESDRTGMRVCVELTRTVDPRQVLADLFKLTPLQTTFGVSLLALVADENGRLEPHLLSLKRILLHYVEHRQEVILRRSRHDLERARQRAHILEGLLRALDSLDEIIALIRKSRSADDAKQGLIKQFTFTELQAQAILDMQLRRLAALERRKLQDEYRDTLALIKELEALLKSPKKVLALIQQNLMELKNRYADPRRTQIADRVQGILTTHDLLPDEEVLVTLSTEGMLTAQRRGVEELRNGNALLALGATTPEIIIPANSRDDLYLFSVKGQATRVAVHQIPEAPGGHFADLSGFTRRDRVASLAALPKPDSEALTPAFLLLGTSDGKIKRVNRSDLLDQGSTNPQVIGLDEGDELLWTAAGNEGDEILVVTAQGQAIRFSAEEVRPMGLPAGGVGGIKLQSKDHVVAGFAFNPPVGGTTGGPSGTSCHLALATTTCYAKRVPLAEFPLQGRNGLGVIAAKVTSRFGELTAALLCSPKDELAFRMGGGRVKTLPASELPEQGRASQGKFLSELAVGTPVEKMLVIPAQVETTRSFDSTVAEPTPEPAKRHPVEKVRPEAAVEAKPKRTAPGVKAVVTQAPAGKAASAAGGPAVEATRGTAKAEVEAEVEGRPRRTAPNAIAVVPQRPTGKAASAAGGPAVKATRGRAKAEVGVETEVQAKPRRTAPNAKAVVTQAPAVAGPAAKAAPTKGAAAGPSVKPARGKAKAVVKVETEVEAKRAVSNAKAVVAKTPAVVPQATEAKAATTKGAGAAVKPGRGRAKAEVEVKPAPSPKNVPARAPAKPTNKADQMSLLPTDPIESPIKSAGRKPKPGR